MGENGAATVNPHFDTSRIGNENMIRAEKQRAVIFQKLINRVESLEIALEILLERSGTSIQELIESSMGTPIEGEILETTGEVAGDGSGEILKPVNIPEGAGFDPERRRVIEDLTEEDTVETVTKEPVSI